MDPLYLHFTAADAPIKYTRTIVEWFLGSIASNTSIVVSRLVHPFRFCIDNGGIVKQGIDI